MPIYTFDSFLVLDEAGNPARAASGAIYAAGDTLLASPLAVTDLQGLPVEMKTNEKGIAPAFQVDTTTAEVLWKSGSMPARALLSVRAAAEAATNAAEAKVLATAADASAAVAAAVIPDNGAVAVGKGELVVNVKDFGAVGDGVTDDTVAVQDFFDYLAANGGRGTGRGSFRITDTIDVSAASEAFSFRGDGVFTRFNLDASTAISAFAIKESAGLTFAEFLIDGGRSSNAVQTHGMSVQNCQDTIIQDVSVMNYGASAVLCMKNESFTGESFNNHVINCTAHGGGVGRNGFLHVTADSSSLVDCHVYNLDKSATPSYGLQVKNGSTHCSILGGSVEGAVAGVAFGYEGTPAFTTGTVVRGVSVRDCNYGVLLGYAHRSDVELSIDMSASASAVAAVYVGSSSENNVITASVRNVPSAAKTVYIGHSLNSVRLRHLVQGEMGTTPIHFDTGVQYSQVSIEAGSGMSGLAGQAVAVQDDSGQSTNFVVQPGSTWELAALSPSGTSRLRFPNPSLQTPRIDLDHATAAFTFRPGGGGGAVTVSQTQVHPAFGSLGYTLGKSDRGWSGVYLRSPNGTIYQLTVDDAGAISVS